jgi:hypothetical protein
MSNGELPGPFGLLARGSRFAWMRSPFVSLGCFLIAVAVFRLAQLPVTPTTPSGLELELPGTADGALAVLRAYDDARALGRAVSAINWDFLLIFAYSIGLATLLEWLATRDPGYRDALIGYAAWGAILAGACDLLENGSMLVMLWTYPTPSPAFVLAALFGTLVSLTKWTLLCAVVGYTSWEVAKSIGRGFFSPKPGQISMPPLQPSASGAGDERRAEPASEPAAEPATVRIGKLFEVFRAPEEESEQEKKPAEKVETT